MMPFGKNAAFVGRGDTLERLEELLFRKDDCQPRAALWGLGGIG
jgi:hypothetical protein